MFLDYFDNNFKHKFVILLLQGLTEIKLIEQGIKTGSKDRIDSGRTANIVEVAREQISFHPYNYGSIKDTPQ